MQLRKKFRDLPIRYKIVFACTALFVPFAILAGALSYSAMRDVLETQINRELSNSTESMLNIVQTSVHLSIRNSLRSVSEKNADIVKLFYQEQLKGNLTETEAKARAVEVLLSQRIAKSGYLYCLDSTGTVRVHPERGVLGQNLATVPFIEEQVRLKNGYIEYDWKNPEDLYAKPKALWMTYFEPWDWIISATAYRDEFDQVVNIDDFRKSIESLNFVTGGYPYVLDRSGKLIVHPNFQGKNVFSMGMETPEGLFRTMLTQLKGKIFYDWQNPGEKSPRKKIVVFDHIPEVDWVVASSAYLDDLYKPIHTLRNIGIWVATLCLLGGALVAMRISTSITGPISLLAKRFAHGATGDYSVRMESQGLDEIGQLSSFFNRFMEQLDTETRERKRLERQVTEADDQERMRIGQELHDDLAPHLIGTEVMCRVLQKKLAENSPADAPQAEVIGALVSEATKKTRALARGLCPLHMVEEGLGFALRELTDTVRTIFPVHCQLEGGDRVAHRGAVAVHLYRIAQEAIYNAVKHAEASTISVTLNQDAEALTLEVTDDGKGLPTAGTMTGMGMRIMNFRARMIGADLEIESRPETGTTVRLCLLNKNLEEGEV
ncbi:MAG: cache domain-containing protein [Trichloromonadaceae bacterium]